MRKSLYNFLLVLPLSAISITIFSCSDRGVSPQTEDPSTNYGFNLETVTDIDGNVYPIERIGSQIWMAENLRVRHYRDGYPISDVSDRKAWAGHISGAYCTYDDNPGNEEIYGLLYNWFAVNNRRNLAPKGWHIPTDQEWQILIDYLGGNSNAGGAMKDSSGWAENGNGTNISKFTALPGGLRSSNGVFDGVGYNASFWSSSEVSSDGAWGRWLSYLSPGIGLDDGNQMDGFSVRCIKD